MVVRSSLVGTHWTKKIIVEDDHSVVQLVNILQLVVRHFKVYYPIRHYLIQHMVNSLQRLGFTQSLTNANHVTLVESACKFSRLLVKDQKQRTENKEGRLECRYFHYFHAWKLK
ncbi:transformation/transcription domain-associated protein-like [Mercenaria mercenaria]|uniref:transformation/transcription domain-associated protein-like n=1 Tax=Mercenaria mercenaria TaxID=6596 RepID=UPI00234EB287|nr:transformation/transcription domain-associated protein-like [Mercenaria mercenaria]